VIEFQQNALAERDPDLGRRFEKEIVEAAGKSGHIGNVVCRIEVEGSDLAAPDRARVVLVEREAVIEWTVALPAAPGDVARAARRALAGRRQLGERRRPTRTGLDRRRP
jgi:hypothetical protein